MTLPALKTSGTMSDARHDPRDTQTRHPEAAARPSPEFDRMLLVRPYIADPKVRMLRGWRRTLVRHAAIVVSGGRRHDALVLDVSRFGAGLCLGHGLHPGDSLTIELISGRRIEASVRWTVGDNLGVVFFEPLLADDELLSTSGHCSAVETSLRGDASRSVTDGRHAASLPPLGLREVLRLIYAQHEAAWRQIALSISERYRQRRGDRDRRRQREMLERACRKQGFSWLAAEEACPVQSE